MNLIQKIVLLLSQFMIVNPAKPKREKIVVEQLPQRIPKISSRKAIVKPIEKVSVVLSENVKRSPKKNVKPTNFSPQRANYAELKKERIPNSIKRKAVRNQRMPPIGQIGKQVVDYASRVGTSKFVGGCAGRIYQSITCPGTGGPVERYGDVGSTQASATASAKLIYNTLWSGGTQPNAELQESDIAGMVFRDALRNTIIYNGNPDQLGFIYNVYGITNVISLGTANNPTPATTWSMNVSNFETQIPKLCYAAYLSGAPLHDQKMYCGRADDGTQLRFLWVDYGSDYKINYTQGSETGVTTFNIKQWTPAGIVDLASVSGVASSEPQGVLLIAANAGAGYFSFSMTFTETDTVTINALQIIMQSGANSSSVWMHAPAVGLPDNDFKMQSIRVLGTALRFETKLHSIPWKEKPFKFRSQKVRIG